MAHLTLQLSAAIVVPLGTIRRHSTDTAAWQARALRETAAAEAGFPLRVRGRSRFAVARMLSTLAAGRDGSPDGNEA